MTDQRPQYGELATPEEQRKAAGLPPESEIVREIEVAAEVADAAPSRAPRSSVDRFATIALLAYGLVNVLMSAAAYVNFDSTMNDAWKLLGIEGEFSNYAQGKLWGMIGAAVLVIGWALTAFLSVRRLRKRKLSWWVPLVGAVVTMALVYGCLAVPLLGDPAFMEYVRQTAGS